MPSIIEISDLTDPRLDLFARLTEAQLRNRLEPEKGIFIAESPKVIQLALDAGHAPVAFLMERKHVQGQAQSLLARCGDIPVYTADRDVLAALTGYPLTRGILCAIRRPQLPAMEDICQGARRVAVLEGIVDTTNVGAIFRSAAALHMDAVLLSPTCCDPLNRRAVRVSMGTVFQIPWARLGDRAEDWPAGGLERLDFYRGITELWQPALKPGGHLLYEVGIGQAEKVAWLLVKAGYENIRITRDTGGIDRVVEGQRPKEREIPDMLHETMEEDV